MSKPDMRRTELETSIPPVLLTESKKTKDTSTGVAAFLATSVITDQPLKPDGGSSTQTRPSPAHKMQETDDRLSLPIFKGDTPITLFISGLRKKTSISNNTIFSERVQAGLKTRVDELMLALEAKGKKLRLT